MFIFPFLDNTNNGDYMKKILVTGARSGIINSVIDNIKNRYYIYVTVENEKQLEIIKQKYKDYNNIECLKLDVTDKDDRQMVEMLDIDIFISNAAIGEGGSISEIPFDKVRHNFEVNVFSNFELMQIIIKQMMKKKKGKIIMVSSIGAYLPLDFLGVYCATKASISMLTTTLKNELKLINNNIKIKLIEPGLYHTGFNQVMLENKYEWMDIDSYFKNIIDYLRQRETIYFNLLERRSLNTIVRKIINAIDSDNDKFIYSAPISQLLYSRIYNLFKH